MVNTVDEIVARLYSPRLFAYQKPCLVCLSSRTGGYIVVPSGDYNIKDEDSEIFFKNKFKKNFEIFLIG
ncbi:hypothetical protein GCM10017161_27470 [Thalassotalea marina]|uniref:Uncharacterized protein n=1 Tax=Thalassotalea marina TaxID=1673741 RepID=A0A919BLU8_9GAMM|nr:hypothetical protein GCM10017161_27470 [Thalassotalea marina]